MHLRRVAGDALHRAGADDAALVARHHLHVGGFADDDRARTKPALAEPVDHAADAGAADLLVVGEREVDRALQAALRPFRHLRQRGGGEGLHVGGPAAIDAAVLLGQRPGIGRPGLAVDRHHVGVARQDHAAIRVRPDRGEQIRLGAVGVVHEVRAHAVIGEIRRHPFDKRQIRVAAGGVERHQLREHRDGAAWVRHEVPSQVAAQLRRIGGNGKVKAPSPRGKGLGDEGGRRAPANWASLRERACTRLAQHSRGRKDHPPRPLPPRPKARGRAFLTRAGSPPF